MRNLSNGLSTNSYGVGTTSRTGDDSLVRCGNCIGPSTSALVNHEDSVSRRHARNMNIIGRPARKTTKSVSPVVADGANAFSMWWKDNLGALTKRRMRATRDKFSAKRDARVKFSATRDWWPELLLVLEGTLTCDLKKSLIRTDRDTAMAWDARLRQDAALRQRLRRYLQARLIMP